MTNVSHSRTTCLVTVAALLMLGLAALLYSPLLRAPGPGTAFALVGMLLFIVALSRGDLPADEASSPANDLPVTRSHIALALLGVACLWLMAEGGGPNPLRLLGVQIAPMDSDLQFGLFAAGIVLFAWGMSGWHPRKGDRLVAPGTNKHMADWVLVGGLMLVGFGLRVLNLEHAVHQFVDEMHFAEGVSWLRDHPTESLLTPMGDIAAFSWFHAYLQVHTTALFGSTLTGLRIVSALFGTLTIPAVYLLGRAIFNRRVGLFAALVLVAFPPHLHMSRSALNNIVDPLFGALALAFLVAGTKRGSRVDFVIGGVCLGLTQYFYEGGKLVYPVAALLVMTTYLMWGARHAVPLRTRFAQIGLTALAFAVVAAPGYYVLATWGESATPRLSNMRLGTQYWEDLLLGTGGSAQVNAYWDEQVAPALLHFVEHPDGGELYYGGATALVLPYLVPFLLAGIAIVLWRFRAGRWALLLVLALTVFGNSLLTEPDWTARFTVTFPVLVVLIAAGMVAALQLMQRGPVGEVVVFILSIPLILIPAVYYFGPHLTLYNQQIRPFYDHQDVGLRAAS